LLLHRKGFPRVRPLLGGIDAWRGRNYPTDILVADGAGAMDVGLARPSPVKR
jgi:hypothetical protein